MLTGNIKDWEKFTPYLPAGLQKALRYLATTEVAKLANGEYKIDGEKVFVRVSGYETKPLNEKKWEAHDAYIDVQYLGSGTERIYYAAKQGQPLTENNLQAKDVAFYGAGTAVKADGYVDLGAGTFAVFYPWELHQPGCQVSAAAKVQKLVVKVRAL
jgi:biofilm protein TabA